MIDRIKAWQCIGCGKIDAPQPCIGICQDRKVEFVHAQEYDRLRARMIELESLVRMFAATTPRNGEWERSYLAMQNRARLLLVYGNNPSVPNGSGARSAAELGCMRDQIR